MDTIRGTAWVEHHGNDIYFVYAEEQATQMVGSIVVVGRALNETKYAWSAGQGDDAPNGAEDSEEAAVAAILAAAAK